MAVESEYLTPLLETVMKLNSAGNSINYNVQLAAPNDPGARFGAD